MRYIFSAFALFMILWVSSPDPVQGQSNFRNTSIINAGASLNYSYSYLGSRSVRIPPAVVFFEMGVHDYVTIGPYAAFSRWSYPDRVRSFMNLGMRGSFHFSPYLNDLLDGTLNEDQIDFYVSMISGLEFRNYGASNTEGVSGFTDNIRFFVGPVAGVRFYFTDELAVFSEVGRGALGAVTVGLAMRF